MNTFGQALKKWRKNKGLSQLDLSLVSQVSSKHISFLETGRSAPSKEMIVKLCIALDIPLSERNTLLILAGFSEAYSRTKIDQPEMFAVNQALDLMLSNHDPFPAMVFDWDWNILKLNQSQLALNNLVRTLYPDFSNSHNIMELLFDPKGYRPFIKNWYEVAFSLLQRIKKEKMLMPDRHSTLIERLLSFPDIPKDWGQDKMHQSLEPMLYIDFEINDIKLKLFSTLTSFGTATDITMQELIIEQYFPVDEQTSSFFNLIKSEM